MRIEMRRTARPAHLRGLARRHVLLLSSAVFWLAGCSPFDLLNAAVPSCGYLRTAGVSYGAQPRQKLDVYRPRGASGSADVVVFFYGGSWRAGSREDYRFVAQALTSRGFIAVLPDYRLYPSVTFPTFVEDGALAVRWVHDNASRIGGDPRRVYLMGHSAGAHIAALLTLDARYLRDVGLDRSAVRATAALAGPYDFAPRREDRAVFGTAATGANVNPAAQPIRVAEGGAPPMLLIHGLADQTIEPGNARRLSRRIQEQGGAAETVLYPGKGHVAVVLALACPFRWLAPTLEDVTAFFREAGRDGTAAPTRPAPTRPALSARQVPP